MAIPTTTPNCPCCGRSIDAMAGLHWNAKSRVLSGRGASISLSPFRSLMFDALWRSLPSGRLIERQEMMSVVYADDPNGGPESDNTISVQVAYLKKQIKPFGLSVKGRSGYQLIVSEAA